MFAGRSMLRLFLVLASGLVLAERVPWWRWPRPAGLLAVAAGLLLLCWGGWDADALGLAAAC